MTIITPLTVTLFPKIFGVTITGVDCIVGHQRYCRGYAALWKESITTWLYYSITWYYIDCGGNTKVLPIPPTEVTPPKVSSL